MKWMFIFLLTLVGAACSNTSTNQPALDTGSYAQDPKVTDTLTTIPYMADSLPLTDTSPR